MPRPVRSAGTPVGLASPAEVEGLASEGALVDLAILSTGEGQAVVLELTDGCMDQEVRGSPLCHMHRHNAAALISVCCLTLGSLPAHVLDGVLVTQPIAALDGVIRMPAPIVLGHVAQGCIDATLEKPPIKGTSDPCMNVISRQSNNTPEQQPCASV